MLDHISGSWWLLNIFDGYFCVNPEYFDHSPLKITNPDIDTKVIVELNLDHDSLIVSVTKRRDIKMPLFLSVLVRKISRSK